MLFVVIFMVVKLINKLKREKPQEPKPVVVSEEVLLLREIRDAIKVALPRPSQKI